MILCCRQKDAGTNATFPETFTFKLSAAEFSQDDLEVSHPPLRDPEALLHSILLSTAVAALRGSRERDQHRKGGACREGDCRSVPSGAELQQLRALRRPTDALRSRRCAWAHIAGYSYLLITLYSVCACVVQATPLKRKVRCSCAASSWLRPWRCTNWSGPRRLRRSM